MKRIIVIASLILGQGLIAQNTLPLNGNVGIGTTTPSAKLDVNGKAIIDSTLIVKDSVRFKDRLIVDKKVIFKADSKTKGNSRTEGNIKGDQKLTIDGTTKLNGNVKMPNIENPNNGILNSGNYEILVKTPSGDIKKISVDMITATMYASKSCTDAPIPNPTWFNGVNKIFTACPQVKVGIGTSNPEYKLTVSGVAYARRLTVGKLGSLTSAVINGFASSNSRDLIQLGVDNASTGGQPEVRFKVTHDGTVYVKELRVRQVQNFPDYVFKSGYKLMNLYDLEKYIKQYKHLPNMPTAAEVARDGASVGEIQRILVEKVEELTLYNIQLKKENDNIKKELDQLKKEVAEIKALITK